MKKQMVLSTVAAVGALSVLLSLPVRQAGAQTVFQAAGPDGASIQSTVAAYRAALGNPNNLNQARSVLLNHIPEHSRGPVHHAGDGPFAGYPGGPGRALRQSALRRHLQHLQRSAPVHAGRQPVHRGVVLRARHQWA